MPRVGLVSSFESNPGRGLSLAVPEIRRREVAGRSDWKQLGAG
jgi:hypothetical protein